jgi:hypothetical protein
MQAQDYVASAVGKSVNAPTDRRHVEKIPMAKTKNVEIE